MWKNAFFTSGFRLTFEPIFKFTTGWNPVTLLYGYTDQTSEFEEIEIDYDLLKIGICIDDLHEFEDYKDFEGFEFFKSETEKQTISSAC